MESEKVKEIKKALECCSSGNISNCNNCPYDKYPQGKSIVCWDNLSKDALTLINELEKENTKLKKYRFDWLNSEKMHLQADMEDTEFELYCANKAFKKVREENQQLKDRITELERENATKTDTIVDLLKNQEFYEKEKLTNFVKMLKDKFGKSCSEYYPLLLEFTSEQLDETLEESLRNKKRQ